jgi:hypothetical protein
MVGINEREMFSVGVMQILKSCSVCVAHVRRKNLFRKAQTTKKVYC